MLTKIHTALVAYTLFIGSVALGAPVSAIAQQRETPRPDLSGRWQLNRELSENAEAKFERMQSSEGGGHRPPAGLHGLGGLFGRGKDETEEAHGLFLSRSSSFVVKQDGDRVELTDSGGRVQSSRPMGERRKSTGGTCARSGTRVSSCRRLRWVKPKSPRPTSACPMRGA